MAWFVLQLFDTPMHRLLFMPTATLLFLTLVSCKEKLPVSNPPIQSIQVNGGQSDFALKFDGINDFIVLDNIPKATRTNNTICARIYIDTINHDHQSWIFGIGGRQSLVVRESGKAALANFLAKGESDPTKLQISWWHFCDDVQPVTVKRWVHFAGVTETNGNTTMLKLYRDGQLISSLSVGRGIYGNSGCDAYIGGVKIGNHGAECNFTSPQRFKGMIDDVCIWNKALSEEEINDIMNRKIDANANGLVGYWTFEEGQGTTLHDVSPFNNDGYLEHGETWVKITK